MLFDERIPYKPFEYEVYAEDGWMKPAQAFWLHTEISMQSDVKDWNEVLSPKEKHLVGNILKGFAQIETYVGDYWGRHVSSWFPKHEIKEMAYFFAMQETIHARAYSYLNETLNLLDFDSFLQIPEVTDRFELLSEPTKVWTFDELKNDPEGRKDIARSLAVFSAFAEGVALYSSFAVLYSFKLRNRLKGIAQQMEWSVRDESNHSKMGCVLFNHLCSEYPELRGEVQPLVKEAALLLLERELKFIDKMFEAGDLDNLKAEDLKEFIKRRLQEKYNELGYEEKIVEWDEDKAKELTWFYDLTGGVTETDFFASRVTDYSREGKENWDDIY